MVNEIQNGRVNALLTKLLSMKEGSPAPTLAPEVISALVLESDRPEWAFLKGERLGIGGTTLAAGGAGINSYVAIVNPLGSGVLGVILGFMPSGIVGTSNEWELRFNNAVTTGLVAQNRAINRDLRSIGVPGGNIPMTLQIFAGAIAAPPGVGSILAQGVAGNSTYSQEIPLDFVLPPGFALLVTDPRGNQPVKVYWRWTERVLDPSETR